MSDHPIIFSGPMVLALLAGRKTMTRRLAGAWRKVHDPVQKGNYLTGFRSTSWCNVKPGDRLWVREAWAWSPLASMSPAPGYEQFLVLREPAPAHPEFYKWRSPIHMPRWASRLTLVVTATKIERVQSISEADARAEGAKKFPVPTFADSSHRQGFERLWCKLHGVDVWNENPEVVAIAFTVQKQNIDAIERGLAA